MQVGDLVRIKSTVVGCLRIKSQSQIYTGVILHVYHGSCGKPLEAKVHWMGIDYVRHHSHISLEVISERR